VYGVDSADPSNKFLRANGEKAMFGWPSIPEIEAEIAAWYDASSFADEQVVAHRLNRAALDNAIYAPLGSYLTHHAWRNRVTGVERGPLPFLWGVSKAG
jgi:peptide/nickel transport system substrate-binding protein